MGVARQPHLAEGTKKRYAIISGRGIVPVDGLEAEEFGPGDLVCIPARAEQWIENIGAVDLVFYAILTPRCRRESCRDC